jgi:hypothetical protein
MVGFGQNLLKMNNSFLRREKRSHRKIAWRHYTGIDDYCTVHDVEPRKYR